MAISPLVARQLFSNPQFLQLLSSRLGQGGFQFPPGGQFGEDVDFTQGSKDLYQQVPRTLRRGGGVAELLAKQQPPQVVNDLPTTFNSAPVVDRYTITPDQQFGQTPPYLESMLRNMRPEDRPGQFQAAVPPPAYQVPPTSPYLGAMLRNMRPQDRPVRQPDVDPMGQLRQQMGGQIPDWLQERFSSGQGDPSRFLNRYRQGGTSANRGRQAPRPVPKPNPRQIRTKPVRSTPYRARAPRRTALPYRPPGRATS